MKGYRRRQYITDRRYQWKFVSVIVAICASGLLLSLSVFNYLSYRKLEAAMWKVHLDTDMIGALIRPYLVYSNLFAFGLTVIALVVFSRISLRRTALPIFRLKRYIENIADGNLNVSLDWVVYDQFADTAVEVDRMAVGLREKYAAIKERAEDVSEITGVLSYIADKPELCAAKCSALIENLSRLKEDIAKLKKPS